MNSGLPGFHRDLISIITEFEPGHQISDGVLDFGPQFVIC